METNYINPKFEFHLTKLNFTVLVIKENDLIRLQRPYYILCLL